MWARKEEVAREWIGEMDQRAEEHGVDLHGACSTPNEQGFYFVMEADSFEAVTGFPGSPVLADHDGHIAPVLPMGEAPDVVMQE